MEEKGRGQLCSYIDEALQNSGFLEFFTSLNGEEELPLHKRRSIKWKEIRFHDLVLEDREFGEYRYIELNAFLKSCTIL